MNILDFISSFLSDTQLIYIIFTKSAVPAGIAQLREERERDQHKRREQKEEPDFQNKNVFV